MYSPSNVNLHSCCQLLDMRCKQCVFLFLPKVTNGLRSTMVPMAEARKWRHLKSIPISISCHFWSQSQSKGTASIPGGEFREATNPSRRKGRRQLTTPCLWKIEVIPRILCREAFRKQGNWASQPCSSQQQELQWPWELQLSYILMLCPSFPSSTESPRVSEWGDRAGTAASSAGKSGFVWARWHRQTALLGQPQWGRSWLGN